MENAKVTDKVMDILKADDKAKRMLKMFNDTANKNNLPDEDYAEARKTMLMLIIASTPAARDAMATEIWEELNAN